MHGERFVCHVCTKLESFFAIKSIEAQSQHHRPLDSSPNDIE